MNTTTLSVILEVVDKGSKELDQFQKNLAKTELTLKNFATGMAKVGAAMAATAAVGLAALTKGAIDAADKLDETAQKVGVGVESLSELQYAAKMSGVEAETLNTGLKKIAQSISEAQNPASEAANAFKALGISVKDSDGKLKSADVVLKEMSKRFAEAPDGVNKTAIAMQLMGKSGADMIPLLNQGADGIKKLTDEARELGIVVDEKTAKAAGDFNDQLDRIGTVTQTVGLELAKKLLPTLKFLSDEFINARKEGEGFSAFAEGMSTVFDFVVKSAAGVIFVLGTIGRGVVGLGQAAWAVAHGDLQGAADAISFIKDSTAESADGLVKFVNGVENATKATKANTAAQKENNETSKKDIDYKAGQAAAAEKLAKEFDRIVEGLLKEKAGFEKLTKEQEINRQITEGAYKKFDDAQKARLIQIAQEIDAAKRLRQAIDAIAGGYDAATKAFDKMNQEGFNMYKDLLDYNYMLVVAKKGIGGLTDSVSAAQQAHRMVYDVVQDTNNRLTTQRSLVESILGVLNGEVPLTEAKRKAYGDMLQKQQLVLQNLEAEAELTNEIANLTADGIYKAHTETLMEQQKSTRELEAWKRYVGDAVDETYRLEQATRMAAQWQAEGAISAEQFKRIMETINLEKIENAKKGLTEFDTEVNKLAKSFQDYMGSAFYDMMQGQFDWTLNGFKKMLDQMVALALARNVANAIFGSGFSKSGMVSGDSAAAGLLGSFVSMLGFRASGGDVQAGQPYIVGEKRAELFVPDTNGTIIPSVDAGFSGGNNVTFQITAMDSQDVLRAMDKIKRPLAEMMNGTNRTYNLGAR